jgi:hypothetical protein
MTTLDKAARSDAYASFISTLTGWFPVFEQIKHGDLDAEDSVEFTPVLDASIVLDLAVRDAMLLWAAKNDADHGQAMVALLFRQLIGDDGNDVVTETAAGVEAIAAGIMALQGQLGQVHRFATSAAATANLAGVPVPSLVNLLAKCLMVGIQQGDYELLPEMFRSACLENDTDEFWVQFS